VGLKRKEIAIGVVIDAKKSKYRASERAREREKGREREATTDRIHYEKSSNFLPFFSF
jgi:hypothetical protein